MKERNKIKMSFNFILHNLRTLLHIIHLKSIDKYKLFFGAKSCSHHSVNFSQSSSLRIFSHDSVYDAVYNRFYSAMRQSSWIEISTSDHCNESIKLTWAPEGKGRYRRLGSKLLHSIVLCSLARRATLTMPLFTLEYKMSIRELSWKPDDIPFRWNRGWNYLNPQNVGFAPAGFGSWLWQQL